MSLPERSSWALGLITIRLGGFLDRPTDGSTGATIIGMECLRCGTWMDLLDVFERPAFTDQRSLTRYLYRCPVCRSELVIPHQALSLADMPG